MCCTENTFDTTLISKDAVEIMLTAMSCGSFIKQNRRWKCGSLRHEQHLDNSVIIPRLVFLFFLFCPAKTKHAAPTQREDEAELCLQIAVRSSGNTWLTMLMLLSQKIKQ